MFGGERKALNTAAPARVKLLACGGTVATVPVGGSTSMLKACDLLKSLEIGDLHVELEACDVMSKPSHLMTLGDIGTVGSAACDAAAQPGITGVVVTHGTDILEEAAYLADLWHRGEVPIVFTGAQRHAGSPHGDGPRNIRDSIRLAASPSARGIGVVVCLGGQVLPATGVRKVDTVSLQAYGPPGKVLGHVASDHLRVGVRYDRPIPIHPRKIGRRVDLVRLTAGDDGSLIEAAAAAGAQAVVVEAFGAGTATAAVIEAVASTSARGTLVAFVSRCEQGGLWPQAGRGGYHDLVAAGAVAMQGFDGGKARIWLLARLGALDGDLAQLRDELLPSG